MPRSNHFIWRKDYGQRLEAAVNHFNNQVRQMDRSAPFTPAKVDYNQIKFSVNSKHELDKAIGSLNSLNAKTRKAIRLPGGLVMTKWERKEIGKKGFVINQRLAIEHKRILNLDMIAGTQELGLKKAQLPEAREAEYRKRNFNPDKVNPSKWDEFTARVEKQYASDYLDKTHVQIKTNFYNAVYKTWGSDATDLLKKIDSMSTKEFMRAFDSNTLVDFDYVYRRTDDYDTRIETLNEIFGMV